MNHRFLGVDQASWPLDHGAVRFSGGTESRTRISSVRSWRRPVGPCPRKRKPWGSNPQAAVLPPPAFQAGSSPVRMASLVALHQAETVRLELTSGCWPPPAFKAGSSSGRMASVFAYPRLRGLDLNQHDDVQSVASCRWMTPHRSAQRDAARQAQVRGGGLAPPSPGSRPGSLPLADPRSSSS